MKGWQSIAVTVAVAAIGFTGLVLLLPSEADRVGLVQRDGAKFEEPDVYEALLAEHPDDPEILFRAYSHRIEQGDIDGATEAAERLVSATGTDMDAVRLLADHYVQTAELSKWLDLMVGIAPTALQPNEREAILARLRYDGRYDAEMSYLRDLARLGILSAGQNARLGMRLAKEGDGLHAVEYLIAFDDQVEGGAFDERLTLLYLLLERNYFDEAQRRSKRWLETWTDPGWQEGVREVLADAGLDPM